MPVKRKFENFDPNRSDSNDDDYDAAQDRKRAGRKSPKKPKHKSGVGIKLKKRTKYRGSDVDEDEDDLSEDSLADELRSESEEEEEPERTETGRPLRSARKKVGTLKEESDEELIRSETSDDEVMVVKSDIPPKKIIRLKLKTKPLPAPRNTRAGSAARSTKGLSVEPSTRPRRHTRAHTEEIDEPLIALSNSGHHAVVVQASASPESAAVHTRPTRGNKGMKMPATSVIMEASNEGSSFSQATQEAPHPMDVDRAETGNLPRTEVADSHETREDSTMYSDRDELAGDAPGLATNAADVDAEGEDDDDDDLPVVRSRVTRQTAAAPVDDAGEEPVEEQEDSTRPRRLRRKESIPQQKGAADQTSDFEPGEESEVEDISGSEKSPKKSRRTSEDYSPRRRGRNRGGKSRSGRNSRRHSDESEDIDQDELLEEALELKSGRKRVARRRDTDILYEPVASRRERKRVDYTIKPMDQIFAADEDAEDDAPAASRGPARRNNGNQSKWERTLHPTYGPFGGGGGPTPVTGVGPWGTEAAGGADSDSSDDENMARPSVSGPAGVAGMPGGLLPGLAQTNPTDPTGAAGGTVANLGKVKSQKALADADPLGVDQNVDFSKVGGLAGHIDQLKEMVQMPLLYPELFLKFHVTPPRGVLFHGPPGTGKTLLARALAASVGSGGRKITFYMRKGADALSKWVGEAERQLRLLFEEARKTQPSIIFFDEIDGLAPVRSSKQEQIHASIVSTLLALMDGMDGRGQVIVIGATNRPDNIDPALRRPGRFDREFYFPLPDVEGRRSIIDIHTRDWGIDDKFKDNLAQATKGYGGADLRALATEAALNAIQRTYPQIYSSNDKLIVNPDKIKVTAKDFMLSIKKMIPSSERATSSGAVPLPKVVEPLLVNQLQSIEGILDGLIPVKKKTTALQEAMYEQYDDADQGFGRETLQQEFEKSRVFRPRLLIGGEPGMGQSYIGSAILNHFEGLHVQNFDLPTIYSDSTRTPETAIVQLFAEVKRHKPSVIYIPGIDTWWHTLGASAITTFMGLLRGIPPTDPVLVLGICDSEPDQADRSMLRELFGFSKKNRFLITPASIDKRQEFFRPIIEYIRKQPKDFPDPVNRKLRKLETLEVAPPPPPREPTKEEIKALKQRDHQVLNTLKVFIQPIMDQIQKKYRKFRTPVVPQSSIQYLYDEQDPNYVRPDSVQFRPYELAKDKDGNPGLLETSTGKFLYNLETTTIEERLSNGYYARPKDFVADIRALAKDARNIGDRERALKANELLANVEVDVGPIEAHPALADCENVYQRQVQRAKEKQEKARKKAETDALLVTPDLAADKSQQAQPTTVSLGDPAPHRPGMFQSYSTPDARSLSNGHRTTSSLSFVSQNRLSNGSSVPSTRNPGDDMPMSGTDDTPQFDSQNMPPPTGIAGLLQRSRNTQQSTGVNTQQSQFSQRSAFQSIPHDMSPSQLVNYASTTDSGKKTSDPSNRVSLGSTQATNGQQELSQFHSPPRSSYESDGQLPDTQDPMGSQEPWPHSQAQQHYQGYSQQSHFNSTPMSQPSQPSQPAYPSMHSDNELASTAGTSSQSQSSQAKDVPVDEATVNTMLSSFVQDTMGFTVEEMEMVYRECMDALWRLRGEHDRNKVAKEVQTVFSDTVHDVMSARESFVDMDQ